MSLPAAPDRKMRVALRGATLPAAGPGRIAGRRHIVFTLAGVEYGVEARHVRRSMPAASLVGPEIAFLGQAYPVLDLRELFGHGPAPVTGRLLLLVETASGRAALLVDELVDLLVIEDAAVTPLPPVFTGGRRLWIEGVARLGSRIVVVVSLESLLGSQAVLPPDSACRAEPRAGG